MKCLRFTLSAVLISLASAAFAQSEAAKPAAPKQEVKKSEAPKSPAQKSFESLKALAGKWEGPVTTQPVVPEMASGKPIHVSLRVTSMGNLLMHEMTSEDRPDDPITTIYLDGNELLLTHYCDAGNRPRMVAKTSPDGKTVEFDFVDISGNTKYGHMRRAVFTIIDENRHTEDWTFMMPGDKQMQAHFDLKRVSSTVAANR
jgi:hypothetical protein